MAESNLLGQQIQGYSIIKKLGSGGYGTVYLGEKEDLGKKYQTAIKHISMPDAEGYEAVLQDYGYDKTATQAHFEKMVEGITSEINMLLDLSKKDNRYIVAYYDHDIKKSIDPLRFDIFMRMEYLMPLNKHIRQKGITLGEVMRLGLNMCDALTLCHSNGVMHRDIKEANIFVNESGNYKLGDFGVAKASIAATQSGSLKGTASYMAPEIYLREPYDTSVDIYSLGIVLYKLLNNQRLPFMPDAPAQFTVDDKNTAETRRLKGDTPPLPANAKNRLGEIIVKACSVRASRYSNAGELKADLQEFLKTLTAEEYNKVVITQTANGAEELDSYTQNSVHTFTQTQGATMTMGAQGGSNPTPPEEQNPYVKKAPSKTKKKKGVIVAAIIGVLILAAGIAGYIAYSHFTDPLNQFQAAIKKNDFESAGQLFRTEIRLGDSEKVEEVETFIVNHAETVKDKYVNSELEYEDALTQLQEMGNLGIVEQTDLQPMIAEVNELRTSRVAFETAQTNIDAGDWKSAIIELRKVIQNDENYANAQTKLADTIRSYKEELFGTLTSFDSANDYSGAIAELQNGLQIVPEDADLLGRIADYEQKIREEIDQTVAAIIQNATAAVATIEDYQDALAELRSAAKQYPTHENIKTAITNMESDYLELAFASVDLMVEEESYTSAITYLNDLKSDVSKTDTVVAKISEVEDIYVDAVFVEADTLAAEKEFDAAVLLLHDLKAQVSRDNDILNKIAEITALRPVDLSTVVVIDSKAYNYKPDLFTDSFGVTYDGRHFFDSYSANNDNCYAVFNLNNEFSTFTGTIVSGTGTSSYASATIAIYLDDALVYSKSGLTKRTGGISFNLDVRGATKLEVQVVSNWKGCDLYLVNTKLEKQQ